ncbi:hypothetical protein TNCV_1811381 [Trichonephila clavipes]|nr:hypothetical protein TNCV_1811381 [Trichonephila clavipes]
MLGRLKTSHASGKEAVSYDRTTGMCNVATPNSGRHLWWTRHPHVHLAVAAQPLFDPRGTEPHRPEDERERCFELTRER